jgi:G3E family GTPase
MRFDLWISGVLRSQGADILRSKGILCMQGAVNRFVFQGVHMLMQGDFTSPWRPGESKTSRLVFIGRNLDGPRLKAEFALCQAQTSN